MVFQRKQLPKEEQEQEEQEELKPLVKEKQKEEQADVLTVVVKELPTRQLRTVLGEDGKNYELFTVEEALTEMLANQREILKFVKS